MLYCLYKTASTQEHGMGSENAILHRLPQENIQQHLTTFIKNLKTESEPMSQCLFFLHVYTSLN